MFFFFFVKFDNNNYDASEELSRRIYRRFIGENGFMVKFGQTYRVNRRVSTATAVVARCVFVLIPSTRRVRVVVYSTVRYNL